MPPKKKVVKAKTKIKKKVAIGNVKTKNQKQKQTQTQRNNQRVVVNLQDYKPKRTYTRRKPAVPKQPTITPQPQVFQPNAQVAINDLTQQLKEREKALQKQIDDKLKNEQKKEEEIVKKEVGKVLGSNPLIQEINTTRINKDADNFFSNLNDRQPPPPRISSLSSLSAVAVPENDFVKQQQKALMDAKAKEGMGFLNKISKQKITNEKKAKTREENAIKANQENAVLVSNLKKQKNDDLRDKYKVTGKDKATIIGHILVKKNKFSKLKDAKAYVESL